MSTGTLRQPQIQFARSSGDARIAYAITGEGTGTCQIGKVIDEHLDVLGVENLMVADTSSIPEIVRGHTYAPALLIAAAAFVELTGIREWHF